MANVYGTYGPETLDGTSSDDTIQAFPSGGVAANDFGVNILNGFGGNDTLIGGAGSDYFYDSLDTADSMYGGNGNDSYQVDSVLDQVVELAGEGNDIVITALAAYSLGANVERLTILSGGSHAAYGNDLENIMNGNAGDDLLVGGGGNDSLQGFGGNDTLRGGLGNDQLTGGSEFNVMDFSDGLVGFTFVLSTPNGLISVPGLGSDAFTDIYGIIGSAGDDDLTGNDFANTLDGSIGNDVLRGLGGDDLLIGGPGNDLLDGSTGHDTADYSGLIQATSIDLSGGTASGVEIGTDTLVSIEELHAGMGNDQIQGSFYDDTISGGYGADVVFGGAGTDTLYGDDGNDTLVGNADIFAQEHDVLHGGAGDDTLLGEVTDDIQGAGGYDYLYAVNSYDWAIDLASVGIEWMSAAFGNDWITAQAQTTGVIIDASGGDDHVDGSNLGDYLWAGVGNDTVHGWGGDDVLFGDIGIDSLAGDGGNDTLYVDGADTFQGGDGYDAVYLTAGSGFAVNMSSVGIEWIADYAGGSDGLYAGTTNDAIVYAGGGGDTVFGGTGNDFLWGEAGNDTIKGDLGNDTLVGGSGADMLAGYLGNDNILMASGTGGDGAADIADFSHMSGWGTDFIYDFEHGLDRIDMTGDGASAGTVTISNVGGHAYVTFGGDLFVVVGGGATFTTADIIF